MSEDPSFDEVMDRLQQRDPSAAAEVFHRFLRRLIGLARAHLETCPKADAEDIVQSAFRSFFTRQAEGRFELKDWGAVWAILSVITLRKCGHRIEYFLADRRDCRREVALLTEEGSVPGRPTVAHEPTPEEGAALAETVEHVMRQLQEPERPVLVLRLQGHSVHEICEQLGRTERSVRLTLEIVKKVLRRLYAAELN